MSTAAVFDPTQKKKKRRPAGKASAEAAAATPATFDFGKKKKKKKPVAEVVKDQTVEEELTKADIVPKESSEDSEYSYQHLLDRIYNVMKENNPDLIVAKRQRYVVPPPDIMLEGTKKTVWNNFLELCNHFNRTPEHVQAFALAELGTTGSFTGSEGQKLTVRGRFKPKQIENVVRHYVAEYVTCMTCKSPDTILKKENRLYFVQCKSCGSTRSVTNINKGYVAQVGRRKKKY